MRVGAASITSRRQHPWLQKHGFRVRLAVCFLSVALATGVICSVSVANLIWLANGVLLAFLLLASRRRWQAFFAAGFAAQLSAMLLAGIAARIVLLLTALNLLEVLIAALLLRKRISPPPHFTDRSYLIRFLIFAILTAPLVSGSLVALLLAFWPHLRLGSSPLEWIAANCLGMGIVTPVSVAILRGDFRSWRCFKRHWSLLLLLTAVTLAAFSQDKLPLLFIVYPLLALVLIRLGMGWAALSTLMVAVLVSWQTLHGLGPFAQSHFPSHFEPVIQLQFFVGSAVLLLYIISILLEREQEILHQFEKAAALNALVSKYSRDAIILADLNGQRSYVTSAVENLGWRPEDLLTQNGIQIIHPDDQLRAQSIMNELSTGCEVAMIECRVQKPSGEYVWVEASLRLVRDSDSGQPTGILNVVRDVSERKKAEQKLQEAYHAVEALAVTDALTGLANRRQFDQYLSTEWRRSMRDRQPLSLIMLDVDKFKDYNDTYGHQRGDSCLKQIAEACMDVVARPGDLVARFGGEEFVVILPNTENDGAMQVAEQICEALRNRRLPHSGNLPGIVTISAGCATVIPKFGKHAPELVEVADLALYKAKHEGRNRVCNGNLIEGLPEDLHMAEPLRSAANKTA
jgi:diguanylate cyclase (GGDEF)-like protein/PAS domain S-box-containing protein